MTGLTLKRNTKFLLVQFLVGAIVGAGGAHLMFQYGPELAAPGAHAPGLGVAALLAILGAWILVASLSRAGAAQLVGTELEPGEDIRPELSSWRWQGLVTLLAGFELMILSLGTNVLTGPRSALLLALLAATLAVQTWFNVELWRRGDELFRQVIVEAGMIGFLIFQFGLFFWVVGSRFALVPDPSALDIYVLMMVLYLLGSGIASIRHGYGIGPASAE
jgi:hypothetical protein